MELSEREKNLIASALFLMYIKLGDERKNSEVTMLDAVRGIYDESRKVESEVHALYEKIKHEA